MHCRVLTKLKKRRCPITIQRELDFVLGDSYVQSRRNLYRIVFLLAGAYNICWGLHAAWDPQWSFRFGGMPELNHPQIYACLGMVIGLYGVLYLEIARAPEKGFILGAVGMFGKVAGPIGMVALVANGEWPARMLVTSIPNDFIWWIPFGMYLYDAWPSFWRDFQLWPAAPDEPKPT